MTLKIDKSLAEVLEWREKAQKVRESLSPEEEGAYIHKKAQDFMRRYNLNLVRIDSRTRKPRHSKN